MSSNKTQVSYAKLSHADIVRSVATSAAVETEHSSAKFEASLMLRAKNLLIDALRFNPFLMLF